jgi:hypothetical protein
MIAKIGKGDDGRWRQKVECRGRQVTIEKEHDINGKILSVLSSCLGLPNDISNQKIYIRKNHRSHAMNNFRNKYRIDSYLRISNYMLNNPVHWKQDKFFNE